MDNGLSFNLTTEKLWKVVVHVHTALMLRTTNSDGGQIPFDYLCRMPRNTCGESPENLPAHTNQQSRHGPHGVTCENSNANSQSQPRNLHHRSSSPTK
jgi:hypothetical protein